MSLSSVEYKGVRKVRSVRTGAEKMACLRLLKAECVFDFSRRDFERSSLVVDIGIVPRGQN